MPAPLPAVVRPGGAGLDFAPMLMGAPSGRLSGTLLVSGDPGGCFHLVDGVIIEVGSPGAPGVETLLLRSGRERHMVGHVELQLVCVMAALDAALAIGMGRIDQVVLDPAVSASGYASPEGIEPEWLILETERRIRALGVLPISPFRDRLNRSDSGSRLLEGGIAGERAEILQRVNGRRTARDIAFLVGRGLYAVTVEASRLLHDGLLDVVPAAQQPVDGQDEAPAEGEALLPRRRPGSSGITELFPLRPVDGPRRSLAVLLAKDRGPGSAQ